MSISTKVLQSLISELHALPSEFENFYKLIKELSSSIFLDERLSEEDIINYRKFFNVLQSAIKRQDTKELEEFDFKKLQYNLSLEVLKDRVIFQGEHLWPRQAKIKQFQEEFFKKEEVTENELTDFVKKYKKMKKDMYSDYDNQVHWRDGAIERYRQENGF